jgi:hypothetical protein
LRNLPAAFDDIPTNGEREGSMSRTESIVVGLVIGIMCPGSLFVLSVVAGYAVHKLEFFAISERGTAAAALAALGAGIIIDLLYLKGWLARFYSVGLWLMVPPYLLWSATIVALLMGLPFGNMALGTLAGAYIGRRQHHLGASRDMLARAARRVGIFTTLITGAGAIPIGVLALNEPGIVQKLQTLTRLDASVITGPIGLGLVGVMCVILMAAQFWLTRTAAAFAFRPNDRLA